VGGYGGEDPDDLWQHVSTEGRAEDTPDNMCEPGAGFGMSAVSGGEAAGIGGLAALEPCVRRLAQLQSGAGEGVALYIDGGKPVPGLVARMVENNRLGQGTISFNVPVGFAALRDAMQANAGFARAFFEDLDMLFYAGASLLQDVWDDLVGMAGEVRGELPLFTSSWGLTEMAPAAVLQHEPTRRSGVVGVPLPGVEVKLVPALSETGGKGMR
jgi:hypothetical protein